MRTPTTRRTGLGDRGAGSCGAGNGDHLGGPGGAGAADGGAGVADGDAGAAGDAGVGGGGVVAGVEEEGSKSRIVGRTIWRRAVSR